MLRQYFDQHVMDRTRARAVGRVARLTPCCRRSSARVISIDAALKVPDVLRSTAKRTEGFSGRELSKLMLKLQVLASHAVYPKL